MAYATTNPVLKSLGRLLISGAVAGLLTACGGDDGPGGSGYPNITYSGVQTQADLSDPNNPVNDPAELPLTMLEGSSDANTLNPLAVVTDPASTKEARQAAMVNIMVDQITKQLQKQEPASPSISGITYPPQAGSCGGSITLTDNSTASTISSNFKFDNYCEGGLSTVGIELVMHGEIGASGTYYLDAAQDPVFKTLALNIPYLKMTVRIPNAADPNVTDTYVEEFSGNFDIVYAANTDPNLTFATNTVVSVTMTVHFQSNGKTYKIENYSITEDPNVAGRYNLKARFYDPDHGYVDVDTLGSFLLYDPDAIPDSGDEMYCDGTLEMAGSNDVIEFTANADCSQYRMCVEPLTDQGSITCSAAFINWP